jgi:hypothetical protein
MNIALREIELFVAHILQKFVLSYCFFANLNAKYIYSLNYIICSLLAQNYLIVIQMKTKIVGFFFIFLFLV